LDDKTVAATSEQIITCAITEISSFDATVSWSDPDGNAISDDGSYTVVEGTQLGGTQDSTLTITSTKLQALEMTSIFTCSVTSGEYTDSGASSNTMTLTTNPFGRCLIHPTYNFKIMIPSGAVKQRHVLSISNKQ
jgi:hypothetical protein